MNFFSARRDVGSTDTAASPLFIKQGQSQFACDAVGEGVIDYGVVGGVVKNDTTASSFEFIL